MDRVQLEQDSSHLKLGSTGGYLEKFPEIRCLSWNCPQNMSLKAEADPEHKNKTFHRFLEC